MESLTLQVQHGDEETIECWDDDDDLQCYEDIHLRTASSATSVTNFSVRLSGHRDSISSRRSGRSDIDSNVGGDEDWQVQLLDNEEGVNEEAIASAKNAGIPLPANLPRSALVGGTIKRLGRRRLKQDFVDDWSEDVEFPGPGALLELKSPQESSFPESLRQISSAATSPVKASTSPFWGDEISSHIQSALSGLDNYQVDDSFGDADDVPTIKAPRSRSPRRTGFFNDPRLDNQSDALENFDEDFDLPAGNVPLQLSHRKVNSGIASPTPDDLDIDWSEGSIGVRFGGTIRDHRSNPSSSVSVVSPSTSSCLTAESEDEGLDGLIIPDGPLDLETSLKKRQEPKYAPSRLSRSSRHDVLNNDTNDFSPETLAASTKRTLTRPTRRRNFGDGTELASFDDLPTSSSAESRFVKLPSGRGVPRSLKRIGVQEPKSVNGMQYNPTSFRWEGNEGLIQEFEQSPPKSPKPAPALITNVGTMQNVQVVGGMVFDPQRMCWLKLAPLQPETKGLVAVEDDDDVFAGLGELMEKAGSSGLRHSGAYDDLGFGASGDDRSCGDSSDEWPMTEEFDVGPEFIRRQRAEEEKWKRKVDKWVNFDRMKFGDGWRWAIRDLVQFNSSRNHSGG
ncbi:hypothetical protein BBP40_011861 [Aspergillus hancockii]|nr:hypothetical protein BBP40_011861 [Aspergillus hancockii]